MNAAANTDPIHMDPDGQWYFYSDPTLTSRYGPYPDPETARSNFASYIQWVNAQANAESPALAAAAPQSDVELAVIEYIAARDAKAELERKHKEELAGLNETLEKLDGFLLGTLQDMGVDSFKTGHGTVFTTERMQAQIPDKGAFMEYLRSNPSDIELLQTRVSTTVLKTWMVDHEGTTPPGVAARIERTVSVRRKS